MPLYQKKLHLFEKVMFIGRFICERFFRSNLPLMCIDRIRIYSEESIL